MNNQKFGLTLNAFWFDRTESLEEVAATVERLVKDLDSVIFQDRKWVFSGPDGLVSSDKIKKNLRSSFRDSDGSRMDELGWSGSLVKFVDKEPFMITIGCGGHGKSRNHIIIGFPSKMEIIPAVFKEIIRLVVVHFDPEYLSLYSSFILLRSGIKQFDSPYVDWMVYLRTKTIPHAEIFSVSEMLHLENGTLIILVAIILISKN